MAERHRSQHRLRHPGSGSQLEGEFEKGPGNYSRHARAGNGDARAVDPDVFSMVNMPNHMRLVARELCTMMGQSQQDFAGEAMVEHISVLLDNPARIGGGVRDRLERLYKAFPSLR